MPTTDESEKSNAIDFERFEPLDEFRSDDTLIVVSLAYQFWQKTGLKVWIDADEYEVLVNPPEGLQQSGGGWPETPLDIPDEPTVMTQSNFNWLNWIVGRAYRRGRKNGLKSAREHLDSIADL